MQQYIESSEWIDCRHPAIVVLAGELANGRENSLMIARACFEWVRDRVEHSWDFQRDEVTCRASDVLHYRTGYCYAKSHLLVALLRANRIAAGLCYQRLSLEGDGPPYCLHGLVAVHLADHGWYRIDPRGNKSGIDAQFTPPKEQLAFTATELGEADLPEIWPEPLAVVVGVLTRHNTCTSVYHHLPDVELLK